MAIEWANILSVPSSISTLTGLSGFSIYHCFKIKKEGKEKIKCFLFLINLVKSMSKNVKDDLNKNRILSAKTVSYQMADICIHVKTSIDIDLQKSVKIDTLKTNSISLSREINKMSRSSAPSKMSTYSRGNIRMNLETINVLCAEIYATLQKHL